MPPRVTAVIDAHLDQVADVFYVSEQDGSKLLDHERQQRLRESMLAAISEPRGE